MLLREYQADAADENERLLHHWQIDVNGAQTHPVYQYLKEGYAAKSHLPVENLSWNFVKYLVDREGNVVAKYAPQITPMQMVDAIEALL